MGKTWRRRRDRRGNPLGSRKGFREADRWAKHQLRVCCDTVAREDHAPDCSRPEAMCGDKRAYEDRGRAEYRAAAIAAETGHPRRAYRCPSCNLWHLTSKVE